jgi:regulator of sirC expression with transglutaminase-like and TPR domain
MSVLAKQSVETEDAFSRIVSTLDDACDLARPALALAADEYPGLNVRRYLDILDDLADEALQTVVMGSKTDCEAARRLAEFLSCKRGFRGDPRNYYDPRNSFLNDVLDRRVGIPITLSLLLIEVGRRLGVPLVGIGFPGHFLVGCGPHRRNEYLLLDPFSDGQIVDWAECELRLRALGITFDPEIHLSPVTNREFFARLLHNLKEIYVSRRDVDRAIRTVARLTQIDSAFAEDCRQFADLLIQDGAHGHARKCLRAYLAMEPDGKNAAKARALLTKLLDQRSARN